ncbi:hypothetical protein [Corynebacterium glyciniphilum]|uniref:hypothetical protein n=1 Tax=Corynebacterium glyciniphilum TaxID=1404244 RepID=UPI001642B902|nr:hypothetical protein [Corynebacterium glyciniphilum]
MMAERKGSVEPKAVIVGTFGAVAAIWLAARNESVVGGLIFFVVVLVGAGFVHWVNRRAGR